MEDISRGDIQSLIRYLSMQCFAPVGSQATREPRSPRERYPGRSWGMVPMMCSTQNSLPRFFDQLNAHVSIWQWRIYTPHLPVYCGTCDTGTAIRVLAIPADDFVLKALAGEKGKRNPYVPSNIDPRLDHYYALLPMCTTCLFEAHAPGWWWNSQEQPDPVRDNRSFAEQASNGITGWEHAVAIAFQYVEEQLKPEPRIYTRQEGHL